MKENEFQCAACGGIFEKSRTHQEKLDETQKDFGPEYMHDLVSVCTACYEELKKWRQRTTS